LTPGAVWRQLSTLGGPIGARYHHTAMYDIRSDRMVVLGGKQGPGDPAKHDTEFLKGPDYVAPGVVTSLAADIVGSNEVSMIWTASGDDGAAGTANTYDLRVGLVPITNDATFSIATSANPQPVTDAAGTIEQHTLGGLQPCTTYYVALK